MAGEPVSAGVLRREVFPEKAALRPLVTDTLARMGEGKLLALIQESLNVATRTGAARQVNFSIVIVGRTVQPKTLALPVDAKLMRRARERLVRLANSLAYCPLGEANLSRTAS